MATARKSWVARALDKAAKSPEAQAAARDMVALALAPVTPAPAPVFPALVEGLGSPEVRVTLEPADVEPRARGRRHQREAAAGLRGHVAAGHDYGHEADIRVIAMVIEGDEQRYCTLVGSPAAIRQAVPDDETLSAWLAAGVLDAPVRTGRTHASGVPEVRRVPLPFVPRVHQMEMESRALEAKAIAAAQSTMVD